MKSVKTKVGVKRGIQGPANIQREDFCKYGDSCRFDHRPPKYLRSLISRLDALEKENKRLLKVIEDQDRKIDKTSENENGATTKIQRMRLD